MIKERLMEALKVAAADYNSGTGADIAVAKAAEAADFNSDQTDRLVEMFNTLAALHKEKDAEDSTGSCELASKSNVAKILLDSDMSKAASAAPAGKADDASYSFYETSPEKSNGMIEARGRGMAKVAADMTPVAAVPEELNVSERCLFGMISDRIDLMKSAGAAADEIVRQSQLEAERCAVKIAKAIEHPFADPELADLFKAACTSEKAVALVSEYSTKVAESKGGRFASMNVFDTVKVDELLKVASELESFLDQIPEYEGKRDFYIQKAAESEDAVVGIIGLAKPKEKASIADFFKVASVRVNTAGAESTKSAEEQSSGDTKEDANLSVKIAELIRKSGISSEELNKLAEDLEKDAAVPKSILSIPLPTVSMMSDSLSKSKSSAGERQIVLNVRRAMLLSDLMANDPIIRDADPNTVVDIYKSIVMSAPRLSLDPTVVRSVLRSGVNSVAISPNDIKTLTDVDKGVALANIERLTALDSSIKDSNKA